MNTAKYIFLSFSRTFTNPLSLICLLVISLILYIKNLKISLLQKSIVGKYINSPVELTASQIVLGIFGAILASFMLAYFGIIFDQNSKIYLIVIFSLILMLINPRYICFSYSGALLGLLSIICEKISVIFSIPQVNFFKINIFSLMTTVAILHFVEGILIMFDGQRGSIPVFTMRDNKILGGFLLKRYYILPMILLFSTSTSLNFYDKKYIMINGAAVIGMAFYAIIGYKTTTFTTTRRKKTFLSGSLIIIYSLILFGMSWFSKNSIILKILVLIFAPFGHECVLLIQRYLEFKNKALYVSSDEGMMVLEVEPDSPASKMGIKSGDMIIDVNNRRIHSEEDIREAISEASNFVYFKAKNIAGQIKEIKYSKFMSNMRLGLILVPKSINNRKIEMSNNNFKKILNNINKK